jgi:hypothetical protein
MFGYAGYNRYKLYRLYIGIKIGDIRGVRNQRGYVG